MFDIGWQELFIVAVLAIIVVGPRDLPRALKTVMHWLRKARGLAREFQDGLDEVAREVELDDLKKEAKKIVDTDLEGEVKKSLDPTGDLDENLDFSDVEETIQKTANEMNEKTRPEGVAESETLHVSEPTSDAEAPAAEAAPEPEPAPAATLEDDPEAVGEAKSVKEASG